MEFKTIGCEDWLNVNEHDAVWDIAQSTLTRYSLLDICSCISLNMYVWSSIYKLQFIQRASETYIRMGWFR